MIRKTMLCIACVLLLGAAAAWGVLPAQDVSRNGGYAGSDACKTCHEDLFVRYQGNVHFRASDQRRFDAAAAGCESCHGPGKKHAEDPSDTDGLITFARGQEARSNAACMTCHRTDSRIGGFARTSHGRRQLGCTECHAGPHSAVSVLPMRTAFFNESAAVRPGRHLKSNTSDLCMSCHSEVRGRFMMPFRHPVREQALSCVSCHDPHQEQHAKSRDRNSGCLSCHEDKRGPWAYEHAPVTEDCLSCHESHGSVAPRLLKTAQPFLCLSCHSLPDDRHGAEIGGTPVSRAIYDRCTSCHGAIHGSHEDRHLKK